MHNGKKVGLALSGGGVRATAFHIGVLRGLHQLGVLSKVDEISTVSGGSIAGAYYLLNRSRGFDEIYDSMVRLLQKSIELRIFLNWRILRWLFPGYTRTDLKASVYRSLFFGKSTLTSLPDKPDILINAACLNTGRSWRFSKSWMGDYKTGRDGLPTTVEIATAVAASTAVPGVFPPIKLKAKDYFSTPPDGFETIGLCDGGVYDNQGTHALITDYQHDPCEYIICSDASAPFETIPYTPRRAWSVLRRQSDVMMLRIRNQQYQRLLYGDYKERCKTAYLSIDWSVEGILDRIHKQKDRCESLGIVHEAQLLGLQDSRGDEQREVLQKALLEKLCYSPRCGYVSKKRADSISKIGTRLRSLKNEEVTMLMHHGETLAEIQIRLYAKELLED